jgi:DNA-binding CsgD family transcriptional regulator
LESRIGRSVHTALSHTAWLRGSLAMARGDLGQADQVLQAGRRASNNQPMPFHRGLLELEHGRCLSRLQQRKAAIRMLRAAHEIFSLLGARPFQQASEAELTAVGLRPRTGGVPGIPGLTAQELRVARLVAAGLSNREAAAQLYLSPKTVEYHLTHAFTKLGVRSRHQLTEHILGRESSRAPA